MEIAESARKHGIDDADLLWAYGQWLGRWRLDDERTLVVGHGRQGQLLELVVVNEYQPDAVITHAMPCQTKWLRRLGRRGRS